MRDAAIPCSGQHVLYDGRNMTSLRYTERYADYGAIISANRAQPGSL
jgi:hypothetical protein